MVSNLEKYKKDLDILFEDGMKLLYGFAYEISDGEEKKKLAKQKRVDFTANYESWYTEALEVICQILPERIDDFKKLYKNEKRKEITFATYTIADALMGLQVSRGLDLVADKKSAFIKFKQQFNILRSAEKRFESSLFDIKQLVQADLFDSELDATRELNKKGFVRGAGAVAGVVLEGHLLQVCKNHKIKVSKKKPTINDFNQPLKDNGVIEISTWRFIQHLADLRNLCDHKKKKNPTETEIEELIKGVEKITKTIF